MLPDQTSHLQYRPDIDGLRAIAVLSVIGFHAAPGRLPSGFIGVDIFFVISGYLISSIILKELESGSFSFADFYSRRIKRIFPALLVVLLSSLIIGYFILVDEQIKELSKHVAGGVGFVSNLILWHESGYFDNASDFKPLLHLWSLGIEEQFYIIWPLFLWWLWKRKIKYLAAVLAVAFVSFVLNIYLVGSNPAAPFYSPVTRFWELLVGVTIAYFNLVKTQLSVIENQRYVNVISTAGITLLGVAFFTINKEKLFPGWWALLPTIGSAFVIWAGPSSWFNRAILSNKLMVWFGLISFPLYLWHWPLLSFLRILEGTEVAQWKRTVAVAVAILLAWLTYNFVEKPIKKGFLGKSALSLLIFLMSVVGLIGYYGYFFNGFEGRSNSPKILNIGETGHFPFFDHISKQFFPCTPFDIKKDAGEWNGFVRCFQSKPGLKNNFAIVGDSHAEHLFPGLATKLAEKNVVFYGKGSIPLVSNNEYDRIFETILSDTKITEVLLAANWSGKFKDYPVDVWKHEIAETVIKLTASGKKVYLTDDLPAFSFMPDRCKYVGRLGLKNKCIEPDRFANAAYLPIFQSLAKNNYSDKFKLIKTYEFFCKQGFCSMTKDGFVLFRDEHHLNVAGSELLARTIADQIFGL